jgi:hypothetical protein
LSPSLRKHINSIKTSLSPINNIHLTRRKPFQLMRHM